ncbi:metal ABC transporter ATP-binding protein [Gordonia sp. i37]|uniref:metal ABC transporter ATP-binding protein n=1 Tax=Gordonia sp. i37 TaxID=1961707 RepID=UPI0009AE9C08|nr:metal ABC transporter ATP-binding protein [Gordonia sp. i37]OPX13479.1 ABC transporter ATP-binding protein [Gordonia sp. i37]
MVGPADSIVLAAHDIRVSLGGQPVLDDVSVEVAPGEFVGLIGANGAGKTTLLRVLLGVLRPNSGQVHRPPRGAIGYLPQKVGVDADTPLRARDIVALGIDGGRLGIPLRRSRLRPIVDEALEAVGAPRFADKRIGELSGGQQQRVLLAHALIRKPQLLLLDEPLAGLDPGSASDIVDLLDTLRRTTGVSIVMTAHDINLLLPVMDRVVYLAGGTAVDGRPDEVITTEVLSGLYGRPIRVIRTDGRILVLADDRMSSPGLVAHDELGV